VPGDDELDMPELDHIVPLTPQSCAANATVRKYRTKGMLTTGYLNQEMIENYVMCTATSA
jgi:hypothetical protein